MLQPYSYCIQHADAALSDGDKTHPLVAGLYWREVSRVCRSLQDAMFQDQSRHIENAARTVLEADADPRERDHQQKTQLGVFPQITNIKAAFPSVMVVGAFAHLTAMLSYAF